MPDEDPAELPDSAGQPQSGARAAGGDSPGVAGAAAGAAAAAGDAVKHAASSAAAAAGDAVKQAASSAAAAAGDAVKSAASGAGDAVKHAASGAASAAGDAVKSAASGAGDAVRHAASNAVHAVVNRLSPGSGGADEATDAGELASGATDGGVQSAVVPPAGTTTPSAGLGALGDTGHLGAELGTTSRSTLRLLFGELDAVETGGGELDGLGDELRAVAALAAREPGVRRALTDAARAASDRSALAHRLFDGKVSPAASEMTARAASGRWSAPRDLVDALDIVATAAEVAAADRAGALDSLEDDLFRFGRIVAADQPLRSALSDQTAPTSARAALVQRLLDGKASAAAIRLATAASTEVRGHNVEVALAEQGEVVAARRNRVVALVRSAQPLAPDQHERLAAALSRQVGQPVQLNTVVDPSLGAGFHVEIGDSVLDASVASRLSDARRRLAG